MVLVGGHGRDDFGAFRWWDENIRVYGRMFDDARFTCRHAKFGGTCVSCINLMSKEFTEAEVAKRFGTTKFDVGTSGK